MTACGVRQVVVVGGEKAVSAATARLLANPVLKTQSELGQIAAKFVRAYHSNCVVDLAHQEAVRGKDFNTWVSEVKAFIAPGSKAEKRFNNGNPYRAISGLAALSYVRSVVVNSVSNNVAVVTLRYCGTQNTVPNWINDAKTHTAVYVCTMTSDGYVEDYYVR